MKSKISMKTAFTKPTRRLSVPGLSKSERLAVLVAEAVAFATKNLNVEFVKFEIIESLVLSPINGSVKLKTGKLELSKVEEFVIGISGRV
jgi:hypothetical protein